MGFYLNRKKDGSIVVGAATAVDNGKVYTKPGVPPKHERFHDKWLFEQAAIGKVSIGQTEIVFHSANEGDVAYTILRRPGAYCIHGGERVGDGPIRSKKAGGTLETDVALEMIRMRTQLAESCDEFHAKNPNNPSSVEVIHFFDCERVDG